MQQLRIAFFSPFPPTRSGISDYSSELLPYLAKHANITLFATDPIKVDASLATQFPIQPIKAYPKQRWQYDMPLYQMGNSAHHDNLYGMFLRYPGIVTLHDYSLHQFIAHRTMHNGDMAGYRREVSYELGSHGLGFIKQPQTIEQIQALHAMSLNKRLLDLSLGIVVHSRYAQDLIVARGGEKTAVSVIPQHITPTAHKTRRHQLPWSDDALIFASAGQITSAKQIDFSLRAFKKVRQTIPHATYLIIGEETGDTNLSHTIQTLGLSDCVHHIGYVADKQEFIDWMYTADIIINLRYPTAGETSAIALRALAVKRPLILFDHGWYSELSDAVCMKVPPLDEEALITAMIQLAQQPQMQRQLGEAGQHQIEHQHHPEQVARAYITFIRLQLQRSNNFLSVISA